MKLRKRKTEDIRAQMEANPHTDAKWYQDCEKELARRETLSKPMPKPVKRVIHHKPPPDKMVTVREPDSTMAKYHKNKQKQSSMSLSPRKKVAAY